MIEKFGPVFVMHLREEIDTISPEKVRAIWPVKEELELLYAEMMKFILSKVNKMTSLPYVTA